MAGPAGPPGGGVLQQIQEAESFKAKGNERFKEGDYRKALGAYHRVFCYVNGLQIPGEKSEASSYTDMMGKSNTANLVPVEKVEDMKKLKHSTNLNMAFCYLKLGQHQKCIEAANKALDVQQSPKAFFRRGQAHLELRNLDEAKSDFQEAQRLDPADPAIAAELRRLKAAFAQHEAKEKKKFSKMFAKMSAEDEAPTPAAAPAGVGAGADAAGDAGPAPPPEAPVPASAPAGDGAPADAAGAPPEGEAPAAEGAEAGPASR